MMAPKKIVSGMLVSALLLGGVMMVAARGVASTLSGDGSSIEPQQALWYGDDCDDPKNDLSGCRGS